MSRQSIPMDFGSTGCVDLHTHVYLPRYVKELKARSTVPRIIEVEGKERILLLPSEEADSTTAKGRPFGSQYWSVDEKIKFMDQHGIAVSVISQANPWLDFMEDESAAASLCEELNTELNDVCAASNGRLLGFGVLSIPGASIAHTVSELTRICTDLPHIRGVILGTYGLGKGLDDPLMDPLWAALESSGLVAFVHPHYGVGAPELMSGYGHILPLALGFPFETTTAITKLILSGMLDRYPKCKLLIAHSGGCINFLVGRLDMCWRGDKDTTPLTRPPSEYLKMLYFDAISGGKDQLELVLKVGTPSHIVFGTDHPFFPPENEGEDWPSTTHVIQGIKTANGGSNAAALMRDNAKVLLDVHEPKTTDADAGEPPAKQQKVAAE